MASKYVLQNADGTTCQQCSSTVGLLCKHDGNMAAAFYICWGCKKVAQVGVGPVSNE